MTTPGSGAAVDYWRAACLLGFSHAAGLAWPPPGAPQRRRAAGHWGCNPGIAWAAGHLAQASGGEFLLIVGTGHAGSYLFAQQALRCSAAPASIREANRRYGQPGGEPTELLGIPELPYVGGELGPALGVGQGIAASSPGLRVVTVIGDGECETPAALAAFAHHDVLTRAPDSCWLPVVNANGARMGSSARFSPKRLQSLLEGMGYTVLSSGAHTAEAAEAARRAWELSESGVPAVWLSITEKGWPAPELLGGLPFRGPQAHKPRGLDLTDPQVRADIQDWLGRLNDPPVVAENGSVSPAVRSLAARIRLDLPAEPGRRVSTGPGRRVPDAGRGGATVRAVVGTASPMAAVDEVLADRSVRVFSPDEAVSNGIDRCLSAGLVTEVLAEEVCSAWTWGSIEAGTPAALVSYEAFAPLVATQLAQYLKLITVRPPAGRPPFAVVLTSLGWGNAPTHQNTDLAGGLLARAAHCPVRVVFPLGAQSARHRLREVLDDRDVLVALSCSKQALLDLPDPGGAAVGIRMQGATDDDAVIVAVGDVAVTEAVAAMASAAEHGLRVGVVALVEPARVDPAAVRQAGGPGLPGVCVSWVAGHHLASVYHTVRPGHSAQLGYRERWGPTAWETLAANGLTRWSLLSRLRAAGCPLPPELDRPAGSEPGPVDPATLSYEVRAI
ncbi:xylulose-5-phosphate/fructose-6-phosphate phosphoketolase [Kitasatospora sp. MAP12-15]|uniref:hypothetical protein n=1 Tax=unclassified Kitasatospora TaxID=2633591 RepID=UPI0024757F41|nr:hypothetical protein [Kitasatospora sp. MAP12-44]MDH6108191.1 xylulose-5-phosphate/fructose-6-phosphate phosphoketolase [Kitasatospora sp. MAP12-44]